MDMAINHTVNDMNDVNNMNDMNDVNDMTNLNTPIIHLPETSKITTKDLRWGIFIDKSGSTNGDIFLNGVTKKILSIEIDYVKKFVLQNSNQSTIIGWSNNAKIIGSIDNIDEIKPEGGTEPACIFNDECTMKVMENIDAALILTDGEMHQRAVTSFGNQIIAYGKQLKAVVGVLVSQRRSNPTNINVSVLVPAMIADSCILHYDGNNTSVMWSCGAFKSSWNPIDITPIITWNDVTYVNGVHNINDILIPKCDAEIEKKLIAKNYISFGSNTFFNASVLINSHPKWNDLLALPFDRICQYFKVKNKYNELFTWFNEETERFLNEFFTDSDDVNKFHTLMDRINQIQVHNQQNQQILTTSVNAYVYLRNRAIARRYIRSDAEINSLLDDQIYDDARIVSLLKFFRTMIRVMEEDNDNLMNRRNGLGSNDNISNSSYSTLNISSSRYSDPTWSTWSWAASATPSQRISHSIDTQSTITHISASFREPHRWFGQFMRLYQSKQDKYNHECSICFQESIPFILMRRHIDNKNIEDLIKNPFAFFYPEIVCDKCADFMCLKGIDPVRVCCIGALPIIPIMTIKDNEEYLVCFSKFTDINYQKQSAMYDDNNNDNIIARQHILSMLETLSSMIKKRFNEINNTKLKEIFEEYTKFVYNLRL